MSVLSPAQKKQILLDTIDGLRKRIEEHMIGDMDLTMTEKITPIQLMNKAQPTEVISKGFRYVIDVNYLDPKREAI